MERVINYVGGTVEINIKNFGIYSLGRDSATGKTYLSNILKSEEDVYVLTYDSENKILEGLREFIESNIPILYFDRFDLSLTENIAKVISLIKDRYIILDFKNYNYSKLLNVSMLSFIRDNGRFILHA